MSQATNIASKAAKSEGAYLHREPVRAYTLTILLPLVYAASWWPASYPNYGVGWLIRAGIMLAVCVIVSTIVRKKVRVL